MIPKFKTGDKVKLLDGSGVEDFTAGWAKGMESWVGETCTIDEVCGDWSTDGRIAYYINECVWTWDERAMELVTEE